MRKDSESNQGSIGIYFKYETEEFKKNQLSDQEIDLSHESITCPSKEGVRSRIILLGTGV
jgi:hypothetical protein